jgi:hypothetical protein
MSESECAICLGQLADRRTTENKCGHIFHSLCVRIWQAQSNTCPVCRVSLGRFTKIPLMLPISMMEDLDRKGIILKDLEDYA